MKTVRRVFLGFGAMVLLVVAGAAVAVTLPPRITWTVDPPIPKSMAPGESTTHTVTLTNTGYLPIPAAYQLRVDVEGDIADYVTIEQPTFGNTFKRNDAVTFPLTVSVPKNAPVATVEGALVLKRVIRNKLVEVWRAEAFPISISIRGYVFLNDTGITLCGDADHNDLTCPVDAFRGQDAEYGRDVTHNDDSDGHAGFSFTKLDVNGNPLAIQNGTWNEAGSEEAGTKWSCVLDNVTGRVWEVKTDDDGLRDKDWTYTWYNSDPNTNGGYAGTPDGGVCVESTCDTEGYVEAVNARGLCGARDWRMPNPRELISIVDNERFPGVDEAFFPNCVSWLYWSASSQHSFYLGAAFVQLVNGRIDYTFKNVPAYVLLMRDHR